MTRAIRFRAKARSDLFEIAEYGSRQWGTTRSRKYLRDISRRISELVDYPNSGADAELDPSNLRKIRSGNHLILYLVNDHEIEIVRVLHTAMDFGRWRD